MDWNIIKEEGFEDYYRKETIFNDITYRLEIYAWENSKSIYLFVGLSSGKKRKLLKVFQEKSNKSIGNGVSPLLWARDNIFSFPKYYCGFKHTNNKPIYIAISWSDSKRRNIYSRLIKYGFQFMKINNKKCLVKKY